MYNLKKHLVSYQWSLQIALLNQLITRATDCKTNLSPLTPIITSITTNCAGYKTEWKHMHPFDNSEFQISIV